MTASQDLASIIATVMGTARPKFASIGAQGAYTVINIDRALAKAAAAQQSGTDEDRLKAIDMLQPFTLGPMQEYKTSFTLPSNRKTFP